MTLVRKTSLTDLFDGDQRSMVQLVVARTSSTVTVQAPSSDNVVPPGRHKILRQREDPEG